MPKINFFSDDSEHKNDASGTTPEDVFAGMQKLDLFGDAPQDGGQVDAQPGAADVQWFAEEVETTAPVSAQEEHIGARVFQSLFGRSPAEGAANAGQSGALSGDAVPAAPAQEEAQPFFGFGVDTAGDSRPAAPANGEESFLFEVSVPEAAAPTADSAAQEEAQAPAQPAAPTGTIFDSPLFAPQGYPAGHTPLSPVFEATPPKRTGAAKPIDWGADLLGLRKQAEQAGAQESEFAQTFAAKAADAAPAPAVPDEAQPQEEAPVQPAAQPQEEAPVQPAAQPQEEAPAAQEPMPIAPAVAFDFDAPTAPARAQQPSLTRAAFDFDAAWEEEAAPAQPETAAPQQAEPSAFDFGDNAPEVPHQEEPAAPAAFDFEALSAPQAPAQPSFTAFNFGAEQAPVVPSAPVQPAAADAQQPVWNQVFHQVKAGRNGPAATAAPADTDQEDAGSTRVFEPTSAAGASAFGDELRRPSVFDFDADFGAPMRTAAPTAQPQTQPQAQVQPLAFDTPPTPQAAPAPRPQAPSVPVAPVQADQAPSTFGAPFDFDQLDLPAEEPAAMPPVSHTAEDIFASLYDADPDEEDEEDVRPARARKQSGGGGRSSGNARASSGRPVDEDGSKVPLIIGVVAVVVILLALLVYNLVFKNSTKASSSSDVLSASGVSDSVDASSEAEIVEPTVEPIPRDEWYMALVNRDNPLTADYTVETGTVDGVAVDTRIVEPLTEMIAAAKADGVDLTVVAGYRSYDRQANAYKNGTTDVPAGASEHNLGLSADIMTPGETSYNVTAFEATTAYQWLRDNAAAYGFILRYPSGTQDITGFAYEPWHYRYVGVDQAQKIVASGLTLEEYLAQDAPTGLPG